jgi:hypothetical protein
LPLQSPRIAQERCGLLAFKTQKIRIDENDVTSPRSDIGSEKPNDVVFDGISVIAERLADTGFRLFKKGPSLERTADDLTFRIIFQASKWNRAGYKAAMRMYVEVSSNKLAIWRSTQVSDSFFHREPAVSRILRALIGNLRSPMQPTLEWDFLDKVAREMVADDAPATVRELALPFFDAFQDPQTAVDRLLQIPIFYPPWVVEYATAMLGREAGQRARGIALTLFPTVRAGYDQAELHLRKADGSPPKGGIGRDLAVLAFSCGFYPP